MNYETLTFKNLKTTDKFDYKQTKELGDFNRDIQIACTLKDSDGQGTDSYRLYKIDRKCYLIHSWQRSYDAWGLEYECTLDELKEAVNINDPNNPFIILLKDFLERHGVK